MKDNTLEKARKWMAVAEAVAQLSKDSTKVGALLVGPGHEILLAGYNGPARGIDDDSPVTWENKSVFVKHAESNLFLTAARMGVKAEGCLLVTTKAPCHDCATDILQVGVTHLITPPPDESSRWTESQRLAFEILHAAGVEIQVVSPT